MSNRKHFGFFSVERGYGQAWPRSLRAYAFARIGAMPVSEVTTADVLAILTPIWHEKSQTARRVRQRIGAVATWDQMDLDAGVWTIPAAHEGEAGSPRPADDARRRE